MLKKRGIMLNVSHAIKLNPGKCFFVLLFFCLFNLYSIASSNAETIIDSDNDGLQDRWRMEYFGNLDNDSNSDFNSDGIINIKEFKL